MATRYELNAKITATNQASAEFQRVTKDVRELNAELKRLDERVEINIDIDDVTRELKQIKAEVKALERDDVNIDVNLNTKGFHADAVKVAAEKKVLAKDVTINVDMDAGGFLAEAAAVKIATHGMDAEMGTFSQGVVGAARAMTASGFLVQLSAIAPAAGLALAAVRPLTGILIGFGSLATSAGVGTGLLAAAIYRLVRAAKAGEDGTQGLTNQWNKLMAQFTGSSSVFDKAAKALTPLATELLKMANHSMPALGREATEVSKAVNRAFENIRKSVGGTERNSLNRILESASDVMEDLTTAAGKAGAAIANIFGNRQVVNFAKDIAQYISDAADAFLEWSRSTQGANQIEGWIKSARILFKSLGEVIEDIADAMGEFSTEDVKTLGRALEGAGRIISDVIRFVETLVDILGAGQRAVKRWGLDWENTRGALKSASKFIGDVIDVLNDVGKALGGNSKDLDKWRKSAGEDIKQWAKEAGRNIGDFAKDTKKKFDDWIKDTNQSLEKWHGNQKKEFDAWSKDFINAILPKFIRDANKKFGDWIRDWEKDTTAWHDNQKKEFDAWASDIADDIIPDWVTDTKKSFDGWIKDVNTAMEEWHEDQKKQFDEWSENTLETINDLIDNALEAWADFMDKWSYNTDKGTAGVVAIMLSTLDAALGPLDEWVSDAVAILNSIFSLLGIDSGDDSGDSGSKPKPKPKGSAPSSGASPDAVVRWQGGIYDTNNVRYMHDGGMVDQLGAYTAATTGLDPSKAQGAMWQGPTGGISDGLSPRVVYGEGAPGSAPKREAYIPEDMEPASALDTLAEAAKWFNAKVGFGSDQPHAHFLPESERQQAGPGTWVMAGGGIIERYPGDPLSYQARVTPGGDREPNMSGPNKNMAMSSANAGGYTLGVPPPNSILNSFMEYLGAWYAAAVPGSGGYHLGVDVVPGAGRDVHAPAAFTHTNTWDMSSQGFGTFWEANFMGLDKNVYSAFFGHLGSIAAGDTGKPDQTIGYIGPYSGAGGGPDHVHVQTAGHPAPVGMDHSGLIDPFDFWGRVGGSTAIPPGYSGGSGIDIWGAIKALIDQIKVPDLGAGPYLSHVASASFDAVIGAITEFARNHLPDFLGSPSSGANVPGELNEWAKQGLTYGNTVAPTADNVAKIVSLAMQESGGDPNIVNPTGVAGEHATGLMQMLPSTFQAYEVASSDNILNPVHNVAASSRYQVDRYGNLVTTSPYTTGGIALKPQVAEIAEHGEEFFMPLHDPESARRFMNFLEHASMERATHGKLPWQQSPDAPGRTSAGGGDDGPHSHGAETVRVLKEVKKLLKDIGIDDESARKIGRAAASGTIDNVQKNPRAQDKVKKGVDKGKDRRDSATGRKYRNR